MTRRFLALAGGILFASAGTVWGAASPLCDPSLEPPPGEEELGYALRGDRCEGLHVRSVSATALTVAGLAEVAVGDLPEALVLRWSPPSPSPGSPIRLRARPLRLGLDYQMDTVRAPGSSLYRWSTEILRPLELGPGRLGLTAWTRMRIDGESRRVYLPLRLAARNDGVTAIEPTLFVLPGRELQELYLTLERRSAGEVETLRAGEPLGLGFYPAGAATRLELPELARPGLYRVELAAELRDGGIDVNPFFVLVESP